ncbi:MAG: hypothetical protein A3H98_07520 [Bacteroidetes bacterium RIFCSPLOWO2_02_FULL_36_8]|nr:MAG: hypothetical protein A3H98_07520 [Bacteroidetes bacterium RIFCSPLOWO2_02_FULL_36_8]OFY71643.1 MAG: hypothetical protein A3G23_00360 [Bacteroidetes bacterium RIFCSPLOWO2_12_FULL_37_12]
MKHLIVKIKSVTVPELYKISILFDDGKKQTIDLESILFGPLYGPLKDAKLFKQVQVDPEVTTVVWPNGADFDPATLYNWSKYESELKERASKWL